MSPDDGRIYDFNAHPPTIRTENGLRERIAEDVNGSHIRGPAVSRGFAVDNNGNILNSPDTPFVNLDHGESLLVNNGGLHKSPELIRLTMGSLRLSIRTNT